MNYGCRSKPTRTFVTFTDTVLGFDGILSFILKRSFGIDLGLFRLFLNIVSRGRPNAGDVLRFPVRVALWKGCQLLDCLFHTPTVIFPVMHDVI